MRRWALLGLCALAVAGVLGAAWLADEVSRGLFMARGASLAR